MNCPKCGADEWDEVPVTATLTYPGWECGSIGFGMVPFTQSDKCRVTQLENAIRTHRSQKADDRCIEDDDRLYETLGDGIKCDRRVGSKCEMLKNCERFIQNRTEEGHWRTYQELLNDNNALRKELERVSKDLNYERSDEAQRWRDFKPGDMK